MPADLKRFTVSVSNEMEKRLKEEKEETYHADTQSEMIRDLIKRGLTELRAESRKNDK